jgi:cold shock CspA family protein
LLPPSRPRTRRGPILPRATDRHAAGALRGTIAVSAELDGFGFIEPDRGGGQLLVRSSSIEAGLRLRIGEPVRYVLAGGTFALEAVAVTPVRAGSAERD